MDLESLSNEARRALTALSKMSYLNGNKPEAEYGHAYAKYAVENNKDGTRPALMLPKKKYRRG